MILHFFIKLDNAYHLGYDSTMSYSYESYDDAPKLHQSIADYSLSGATPQWIAIQLNCSEDVVSQVLEYPPISRHVARVSAKRMFGKMSMLDKLDDTLQAAVEQMQSKVVEGELNFNQLVKAIELLGDRLPNSMLTKKTKQITEYKGSGQSEHTLTALKQQAIKQKKLAHYTPEVVDIGSGTQAD